MKRVVSIVSVMFLSVFLVAMVSSADVTVTSAGGDQITFTDEEIGSIAAGGEQP
ncbi:MAG: hypothetical protein GY801_50850, partial [bacterium]|nr:hypothetical protein [bacterium]